MLIKRPLHSAAAILLAATMTNVQADSFVVTTTLDEVDANPGDAVCATAAGACTLRAAVQEANALVGPDSITLPEGLYVLALENPDPDISADEQASAWGDLDITDALSIEGAGPDLVAIDAMAKHRVVEIWANSNLMEVSLSGLTIRNGNGGSSNGNGGGISSESANTAVLRLSDCNVDGNSAAAGGGVNIGFGHYLVMNRCVVSNNTALSHGAGLNNLSGSMTINDSVIRDNRHFGFSNPMGGGIFNQSTTFGSGPSIPGVERSGLNINRSLITGNSAFVDGGGVYHVGGALRISNTTISDNLAERWGGGVYHAAGSFGPYNPLTDYQFHHVTITNNVSIGQTDRQTGSSTQKPLEPKGGGIYNNGQSKIAIYNSILAGNGSGQNCFNNTTHFPLASITKQGNIITDDSCLNDDETPQASLPAAGLMALADNGGASQTHALSAFSDAVNIADAFSCQTVDQRGYDRDADCDAGSYEFAASAPLDELSPVPAYAGPAAVRDNVAPLAFGMPLGVNVGGTVSAVVSGADSDGDVLSYEFTQLPVYGTVGWDGLPPGRFTYTADPDLSNGQVSDSFSFRACDGITCSDPATVTIFVGDEAVSNEIAVSLTSSGTVSDLTVVAEADLEALVADVDYSAPLGAFFFGVSDIPTDSGIDTATVVLSLPAAASIDSFAVVRKLDIHGEWQTLSATGDGSTTTAVIDPVAKTITLTLVDNDSFDHDSTVGVIYDPVALSVPNTPVVDELPAVEVPGEPAPIEELVSEEIPAPVVVEVTVNVIVDAPATELDQVVAQLDTDTPETVEPSLQDVVSDATDVVSAEEEGGAASFGFGLLPLLLLGWGVRRRG